MNNAWGYVRLSQSGRDASLDEQKRAIREYARANDLPLATTRNDGEGTSGFDTDRPEYQLLREKIEREEIGAVIVRDRARLSRDFDERLRLIVLFRHTDVEWHVVEAGGRIAVEDTQVAGMEAIHAMMDDIKKRQEIERARSATDERLQEGLDHGRPKFGMTYDDEGRYQVPGDRFDMVQEVLEADDRGANPGEIAEQTGLHTEKVRRVLENREFYKKRAAMAGVEVPEP
jgi:DNA invertase Pin-like site-specific DNA recombinase